MANKQKEVEEQLKKTQELLAEEVNENKEENIDEQSKSHEDDESENDESQTDEEDNDEKSDDEQEEDTQEEEIKSPQEDYKKRYAESTREAQKLYKNNIKVREAIDEADKITIPTEEEMTHEYPEWDVMSDLEKRLATDNFINKKKFDLLHTASQVTKNIEEWNNKVDRYIEDPKTLIEYPELEGKEEEFKLYSTGKEGIGTNFDILVGSFLHNFERNRKPKQKGKMMEQGKGGPKEAIKQKGDKISLSEANKLMRTNYKEYKKYLVAGKIDNSEIE